MSTDATRPPPPRAPRSADASGGRCLRSVHGEGTQSDVFRSPPRVPTAPGPTQSHRPSPSPPLHLLTSPSFARTRRHAAPRPKARPQ
eukprot:332761-Rhodomonas_salina.2